MESADPESSTGSSFTPAEEAFLSRLNWPAAARENGVATALPAVYEELRRLAGSYMRGERANHTLQPTALVHEAYLRLLDQRQLDCGNRAQFIGIAARMMRRILTNHALARQAAKRGGDDVVRVTLDEALDFYDRRDVSVVAVDEALRELEQLDPQQARIVELRFFGGLTTEEVGQAMEISTARVKREWATAKLWLKAQLSAA